MVKAKTGEPKNPRKIRITSYDLLKFHLRSHDLEKEAKPGEPAELSLDATISGRFDLEDHNPDVVLLAQLR